MENVKKRIIYPSVGYEIPKKLAEKIQKQEISYHYFGQNIIKRPKYRNHSCQCYDKHWHQSILEADYCCLLFLQRKSGKIKDFEIQKKFRFNVAGVHVGSHIVDFFVSNTDGSVEVHEVKGYPTELWKMKEKLFKALFPEIPYIVKVEAPKYFKGKK